MFDIFNMFFAKPYEERAVKRDEFKEFILDTVEVPDRSYAYETAVAHEKFNGGKWVILEGVDTKEEALTAHEKWLEKFKEDKVNELYCIYAEKTYKREV